MDQDTDSKTRFSGTREDHCFTAATIRKSKDTYNALKKALEFYEKIEKTMPKEEQWRLMERQKVR